MSDDPRFIARSDGVLLVAERTLDAEVYPFAIAHGNGPSFRMTLDQARLLRVWLSGEIEHLERRDQIRGAVAALK